MSIADEIAKTEKDAAARFAEAERLKNLSEVYPDVRKHVGRWNKVVYCSKSVNAKADRFDMRHNCGCCNDSPLEVWPYLETPIGNVYSDPPMFVVGERDPMTCGDRPTTGWRDRLNVAGIQECIISAVSAHFEKCRDEAHAYADSLYEEEA